MACSISRWASSGLQSGVSYFFATSMLAASNCPTAPASNCDALLSVGEPLIWTIGPVGLPSAASLSASALPWSSPTFSLSNET